MGIVYAATDAALDRKVAVKVLRAGPGQGDSTQRRFAAEARAIARVRHPSIVEVFDHGTINGHLFYAMSLVDGMTLREAVELEGPLSVARIAQGGAQIAGALGALHAAGVVHRDVKPQNIMIDRDGCWVLADFGLARIAEAPTLTAGGQVLGTPLYMSPEQILGDRDGVDGRSDIYGLGAALYEAVAGRAPFLSEALPALLGRVATQRPAPPSAHRDGVPRDVDRVLLKCLEKSREDRYASAASLGADLAALGSGAAVRGRPVSRVRRAARRARRQWRQLLPAAFALGMPLFALGAWMYVPGSLHVGTLEGATVAVGDEAHVPLPDRLGLAAGNRVIRIGAPGFHESVMHLTVMPWGEYDIELPPLHPLDPRDLTAQNRLGHYLDVPLAEILPADQAVEVFRSQLITPFLPILPRGDVTPGDLKRMLFTRDYAEIDGGRLVFRRGEELLYEEAFDPDRPPGEGVVPEAVRAALMPGDTLTWGLVDLRGRSFLATARVVSDPAEPSPLDRIQPHASELGPVVTGMLVVRALLAAGRADAALTYLDRHPVEGEYAEAFAGLRRAVLRRLFRDDLPALRDSELWRRANRRP